MILGAEIGLLFYGIYSLITGKFSIGKGRSVIGVKARILGAICVLPLPIAFSAGLVLGIFYAFMLNEPISPLISAVVEIIIIVAILIIVSFLGKKFYIDQEAENFQQSYLP
jgi:uncharacterized protein YacL